METQDEEVRRVLREEIELRGYDPRWPELFREERDRLLSCLPRDREAYTAGKTEFVVRVTEAARAAQKLDRRPPA
ncbi:MAG: hypothetical protein HYY18_12780 [Planctomycetes bacterium]|nr:hypothetical protein [Planctomycetota bacterium]